MKKGEIVHQRVPRGDFAARISYLKLTSSCDACLNASGVIFTGHAGRVRSAGPHWGLAYRCLFCCYNLVQGRDVRARLHLEFRWIFAIERIAVMVSCCTLNF